MNKHLLFIPFFALLATSCGGGHITTTPVINAPKAQAFTPTRKQLANATNTPTYEIDLGKLSWNRATHQAVNYYFFSAFLPTSYPIVNRSTYITEIYTNKGWGYLESLTDNGTLIFTISNTQLVIRDDTITSASDFKIAVSGYHIYYQTTTTGASAYNTAYEEGYSEGFEKGTEDGYNSESNKLIPNGQYTGLTIFPRRNYLEKYAEKVMSGEVDPENGQFYLIDTNANYTIEMKWTYNDSEKITTFYSYGDLLIGELDWHDVAEGYWNSTWFGKYDAELHHFMDQKNYATNEPIDTSFYPEVYIGSTFTGGDPNLYFSGGGNGYQMGFADGQTQTIHASETYNNVFTIFAPAFGAVASFMNMNIGPFKVWYFFAIPLIVTLLVLVLRLVKH